MLPTAKATTRPAAKANRTATTRRRSPTVSSGSPSRRLRILAGARRNSHSTPKPSATKTAGAAAPCAPADRLPAMPSLSAAAQTAPADRGAAVERHEVAAHGGDPAGHEIGRRAGFSGTAGAAAAGCSSPAMSAPWDRPRGTAIRGFAAVLPLARRSRPAWQRSPPGRAGNRQRRERDHSRRETGPILPKASRCPDG